MPKAAAAPEAKNSGEPFIPEPVVDTTKSLGLVEDVTVYPGPGVNIVPVEPSPKCKRHPDRDAIINSRGISTGQCGECLVRTPVRGPAVSHAVKR